MGFKRFYLIFYLAILCFLTGCFQSEHENFAPDEHIYCDLSFQYTDQEQKLKAEARFSISDKKASRPYFLTNPVFVNQAEMEKKFIPAKGVYYFSPPRKLNKNNVEFSFTDLDEKPYKTNFNFNIPEWKNGMEKIPVFSLKGIKEWKRDFDKKIKWVILDNQNHMHSFDSETVPKNDIPLGNATIIQAVETDTVIQLGKQFFIRCNMKSLSKPKQILITP